MSDFGLPGTMPGPSIALAVDDFGDIVFVIDAHSRAQSIRWAGSATALPSAASVAAGAIVEGNEAHVQVAAALPVGSFYYVRAIAYTGPSGTGFPSSIGSAVVNRPLGATTGGELVTAAVEPVVATVTAVESVANTAATDASTAATVAAEAALSATESSATAAAAQAAADASAADAAAALTAAEAANTAVATAVDTTIPGQITDALATYFDGPITDGTVALANGVQISHVLGAVGIIGTDPNGTVSTHWYVCDKLSVDFDFLFGGLSVTLGANDSGGSGYRALVVPNA